MDESMEVACNNEAGRRAIVRTGERRLDRYQRNLAGDHRRRDSNVSDSLAAAFGEASATFFHKKSSHQ